MMRHQLTDLRARGAYLSVPLASEAGIYGRFGYGRATCTRRLTVPRHRAAFATPRARCKSGTPTSDPDSAGSTDVLRRAECREILEVVYDPYRRIQPGALSRPPPWWARGAGRGAAADLPDAA